MDGVTIRRVTADDAGAARALRIEMLADAPLAFVTTLAEVAAHPHDEYVSRCVRAAEGNRQAMYVADAGGRFVGQIGAYEHPHEPDITMLYSIYVTPAHRGNGALGALLDAVSTWSRASGRSTLELEVVTTNGRAIRAYQKLGFVRVGNTVAHPTIPVLREQRMVRRA
ncbi:MAG TPA: GNAT family N-acetyltransferase [Micromonosporaceae bacterium]|jgi:ribosomal protein S18 acetylase RimI-like enzyme|nr:GNAT family N-acetyltransferase [Micromonosporaceae bacterium]